MAKRKNEGVWQLLGKLAIGQAVLCEYEMVDQAPDLDRHEWKPMPVPRFEAWISGATWVCNGVVNPGFKGGYGLDGWNDYEPATLVVEKKIPVLLVRRSMFSKEIKVPIHKALSLGNTRGPAPIMYQDQPPYTERHRELYREEAAKMPRDKKGRFLKKGRSEGK